MTTSGTTFFNLQFTEAIEEAGERAGFEVRDGYSMRTARRSINLMLSDWSNRGMNAWEISERSIPLIYATASYSLTPTNNDVIDVIEQTVSVPNTSGTNLARLNLTRVSISTQATRVNPNIQGRPTEVWYDRSTSGVTAHIWPLPDATGSYVMYYTVLRRLDDAGAYTNTADIPFRFLPPFISGLAYYLAEKKRQDDPNLIQRLQQRYESDWQLAADNDRERATLSLVPRGDSYRIMR